MTEAPVFSKLPRLPTLVGQFVHTLPLYWSLPLTDRLTMLPFLATLADYCSRWGRTEGFRGGGEVHLGSADPRALRCGRSLAWAGWCEAGMVEAAAAAIHACGLRPWPSGWLHSRCLQHMRWDGALPV